MMMIIILNDALDELNGATAAAKYRHVANVMIMIGTGASSL